MNQKISQQEASRYSILDKYTIIFLLSGKAGVGKTTIADFIYLYLKDLKYSALLKTSFATGVKNTAVKCFNWDGKKDGKGRKLLQDIGRIGRAYDEDIWVRTMLENIYRSNIFPLNFIIVDDWRFPNEAQYLEDNKNGFRVIKIRVDAPKREILRGTSYYDDISETALPELGIERTGDYYDWFISNKDDGLDELDKRVVRPLVDNILDKLEKEV